MSDDIVQTIKIEVEGADEAAAEIKKVGEATEEVQQTAATTAGGTKQLGEGLDQVSQKSGVSQRQLRALGRVMKDLGGGELASTGIGFARFAMILGPVGASLFALGAAFTFIKGKMKEAEDQAKALATTFATLAQKSSEMKLDAEAAFWGKTTAEMKAWNNEASRVVDQYKNIEAGRQKAISADVSPEARQKGLIEILRQAGVQFDDVNAGAETLNENGNKALMVFAKLSETMSPIGKANLAQDMKGLGFTDEQVKSIEKGSEALKKVQAAAAKPFFTPEQKQSVDELGKGWDEFAAASQRAWAMVAGDAAAGTQGIGTEVVTGFVTAFAKVMGVIGQFERDVVQAVSMIPGQIGSFFSALPDWIGAGIDAAKELITAWVTTPVANAWGWITEAWSGIGTWISTKLTEVTAALTAWVTTPIANAWQWIVDAWNAMVAKLFGGKGGSSSAAAPATQGMAGGGLLGGRGSGTSDSNLAWVSRGEYIVPARVVQQPGVLALLEALRRSGRLAGHAAGGLIPAYAEGGKVDAIKPDEVVGVLSKVRQLIDGMQQTLGRLTFTMIDGMRGVMKDIDKLMREFSDVINGLIAGSLKDASDTLWDFEQKLKGHAGGGLLGGHGTGTSDSNLAWVSRGEHIMPARAVAQPGVLAFLEALRRSGGSLRNVLDGMGRFALGGMVRAPLAIPAFAGGGMNNVTIQFPGLPEITGLRASSAVVDELRKAAAMAQVRSGGRKPSRYS